MVMVPLQTYLKESGDSEEAVRARMKSGEWIEGEHYTRPRGFRTPWVNVAIVDTKPELPRSPLLSLPDDSEPTDLYRHFDQAGKLLYVGISISAVGRLAAHAQRSRWTHLVARVEITKYPSRKAALIAEEVAIRDERPEFNIRVRG